MRSKTTFLLSLFVLIGALNGHAAVPDTDLLLPYFETGKDDAAKSTVASIYNSSNVPVDVVATLYSNWAIPIMTVPMHMQAHATQPVNLRDWLIYGALPGGRRVCADGSSKCQELKVMKAQLSGAPSPHDQLYYASAAADSMLTGFVVFHASSPVVGDYYFIDATRRSAAGQKLVPFHPQTTGDCNGICKEQSIRFMQGGDSALDTGLILWSWNGIPGQPSVTPQPQDEASVQIAAFDESGNPLGTATKRAPVVSRIPVADLKLGANAGSLRVTSNSPTLALASYSAAPSYQMLAESSCDPCPAPVVSASLTTGSVGVPFVSTIIAPAGATLSATNLPAGLSLAGNIVSGTPTEAGNATITVTNACGSRATVALGIAACSTPTLTATNLLATVGLPFTTTFLPSVGATVVLKSALPAGLTLTGNLITGTPLAAGTFDVAAQNACGESAPVTITVGSCVTPVLTSTVLGGTVGLPFVATLTAGVGSTITATGLPAGLSLSGNLITGTPTATGTIHVTANAACGATATLDIPINACPVPTIAASVLTGTIGLPFATAFTLTPGATLAVTGLPAGLTLSGNLITGTPTATGTIHATVTAACGASASIDIPIEPCPLPTITASVLTGTVGLPFATAFALTPGATLAVTGLPAGLTLSGNLITGTPTATGTIHATVTAPCGASASVDIPIGACPLPTVTASLTTGTVGLPFLSTLILSPDATVTVDSLPAGLTLSGNVISGTPTEAGTFTVTATAACGAVATTTVTIAGCTAPAVVTDAVMGTVGLPFLSTITASVGATITVTDLPAGLTLAGNIISGTPAAAGTATITATAACGATATTNITIEPCPLPTITASSVGGTVGLPFISVLLASPGATVCVQGLPAGLSVVGDTISGTATGTAIIHVIATSPCGAVATIDIPISSGV